MPTNLDTIALRTLELRREDGSSSPVLARVGRPRAVDGADYRCEYEIDGLATPRRSHAYGIDEVQALWLALVRLGVDLQTSSEGKAGRIALHGEADLNFPPPEALTQPEWHVFAVDGDELFWRAYSSWQRMGDGPFERCRSLEVACQPNAIGVGASYPAGAVVDVEHARALVRAWRKDGHPGP